MPTGKGGRTPSAPTSANALAAAAVAAFGVATLAYFGVATLAYFANAVASAVASGAITGNGGAVFRYPDPSYLFLLGMLALGIVFPLALLGALVGLARRRG